MNKFASVLLIAFQVLIGTSAFAALKVSVADGDWEDGTTWLGGTIPVDGDDIYISPEDTVFIQSEIRFHGAGMVVTDAGALNMINGKLHLPSNSTFSVTNTGKLLWTINAIGCNNNLKIGPSIMWKGCWGDITSPTVFGTPLPVELISFKAEVNEGVQISWSTASEINSDYFLVERQTGGDAWEFVGTVKSVGNSNELVEYSISDESELSGVVYYRLTQFDINGEYEVFDIISVSIDDKISLLNNPVANIATIQIDGEVANWSVIDLAGNALLSNETAVNVSIMELDFSSLKTGVYILVVSNGITIERIRFVKN